MFGFYILDTHSPHQVFNKNKIDCWNIAISLDSPKIWDSEEAITFLLDYGLNNEFVQ